jgi:hypothetical protein
MAVISEKKEKECLQMVKTSVCKSKQSEIHVLPLNNELFNIFPIFSAKFIICIYINVPTRSLLGPVAFEFQLNAVLDGHIVYPSQCFVTKIVYLKLN